MQQYILDKDGPHRAAVRLDRAEPFHHEEAFIRFRPYTSQGSWDGRDAVADVRQAAASAA